MSIAKDLTNTWKYFTKYGRKSQAKHLLENCTHLIIHKIGKLKIFKLNDHFEVINSESLVLKFFDTETEAMNYCLDIYPETKINEQQKIEL